jgi:ABC-type histidine transport system ATPase subunit
MLTATDIRKSFGTTEVLKGLSLEAARGDVIAMIGSSGSGKSTFLRCLNFLDRPTGGRISLDGRELVCQRDRAGDLVVADSAALRHYRARVTMVFQQFNLWSHMTARENVMLGPMRVQGLSRTESEANCL